MKTAFTKKCVCVNLQINKENWECWLNSISVSCNMSER